LREIQLVMGLFYHRNFHVFSRFSGLQHDLDISFDLNGKFLLATSTLGSVKVIILDYLKPKLFLGFFFQNPSYSHMADL
jgi:hypothetical protein